MITATKEIISANRDDILIYEVGRTLQEKRQEYLAGVPSFRLKKTLAAMLRHWDILRTAFPECGSINYWSIQHAAFRHGQVVYRLKDRGATTLKNEFGVLFLEDIIIKSPILKSLGVSIKTKDNFEDRKTRFIFPAADAIVYGIYLKTTGLGQPDLEILQSLAVYYAHLRTSVIESLSTCPTQDDCRKAMLAEFVIWFHDLDRIFRLLKPSADDYSVLASISEINRDLKRAFDCGAQVGEKLNWYSSLASFKQEMIQVAIERNSFRLVNPVLSSLGSGEVSDDLSAIKDWAKLLTGFLGLLELHLQRLYPSIALPQNDSERARSYINRLQQVGITPYLLRDLEVVTGKKQHSETPVAVEILEGYYDKYIIPFLMSQNMPSNYERIKLFSDV